MLLTLEDVVDELLWFYGNDGDWPADHRCTKTGRHTCDHSILDTPLVDRLEQLVERGTGLARPDGGKQKPTRLGSPAPWAAAPAELLMEIWHRSIDFADEMRGELGFGPLSIPCVVDHPSGIPFAPVTVHIPATRTDERVGGRAALIELPGLCRAAVARSQDAALVAGWLEQQIRGWHRRALLITGYTMTWAKLDQIRNEDHLSSYDTCGLDAGGYIVGPACLVCKHPTCSRLRRGRTQRWVQPQCPHCRHSMLRRNPTTQAVHCLSPRCVDDLGKHHVWALEDWINP